MPIYEYACPECDKRIDRYFASSNAANNVAPQCPSCHAPMAIVEWSRPARRDPEKGIQR